MFPFNLIYSTGFLLYSWKTSENLKFFKVFRNSSRKCLKSANNQRESYADSCDNTVHKFRKSKSNGHKYFKTSLIRQIFLFKFKTLPA